MSLYEGLLKLDVVCLIPKSSNRTNSNVCNAINRTGCWIAQLVKRGRSTPKMVNLRHFANSPSYEERHFMWSRVTFVTRNGGTCDTGADCHKSGLAFHETNSAAAVKH